MSHEERSAVEAIIYDLLATDDDRGAVEAAAIGDFDDLRMFVSMMAGHDVEPPGFWDTIVAAFGGIEGFQRWLEAAVDWVFGEGA